MFSFCSFGQRNLSLYSLKNTPQAMQVNPAFRPKTNVFLSIPVISTFSFAVNNSGFSLSQLLVPNSSDSLVINSDDSFFNSMPKHNYLNIQMQNQLFSFGWKYRKNFYSFDISNTMSYEFDYTSDCVKFLFQGNGGSLLGNRADFDGIGLQIRDYISYGIGYNREVNEKLTVGGKLKILSGVSDVSTESSTLGITTGSGANSLAIDGSLKINTSNAAYFFDSTKTMNQKLTSFTNSIAKFGNLGFAVDLGATYALSEKINVSASMIDLGFINWKSGVQNFEVKQFNYQFNGVDVGTYVKDTTNVFTTMRDSITQLFKRQEDKTSYRKALATKFYIGGTYSLNKSVNLGALWYSEIVRNSYRPALVISSTVHLKSWLSATLNYGMYASAFNNLGIGLSLRGGPIQFVFMSDNILALPFFNMSNSRSASFSFGINLMIGKGKDKKNKKEEEIKQESLPVSNG
jgi:hypothetical protein